MPEEHAEPGDEQTRESEQDDRASTEAVVEPPGDDGADARDEVRGDAEDHDLVEREVERYRPDHGTEREDARESVAVDGAREQEPERGTRRLPQSHDVVTEHRVAA